MVKVKFCGFTTVEDVKNALEIGVDYLGFNFFEKSPRFISLERYYQIEQELSNESVEIWQKWKQVRKVAILVNAELSFVEKIIQSSIDILQFHGQESPEFCGLFYHKIEVWKALSITDENIADEKLIQKYKNCANKIVLDTVKKQDFSSGESNFENLELFEKLQKSGYDLVLAGGLNSENIQDYMQKLQPATVDVASGVEDFPGKKSLFKMQLFLSKIHQVNKKPQNH